MLARDGVNLPESFIATYDAMGNLVADSRKGLQFSYNLANLPCKAEGIATDNAGLTLNYGYLSDGTKTSSVTGQGEGLKYRGSFVYEVTSGGAERLNSIAWDEGRIAIDYSQSTSNPYVRDEWHVRDHLGSTRMVIDLTDYGTVIEKNEYLPFGTRLPSTNELAANRYRLAGKEEQRFGAGSSSLDLHLSDFGARYYDPYTARWTTRDPLAGKYPSLSPHSYCAGNPVDLIDPLGADLYLFDVDGNFQNKVTLEGEHRLAVSTVDKKGNVTYYFYNFADPENDPADIDRGAIKHVEFVSEKTLLEMISGQDGFSANMLNFGIRSRGGQRYDYSTQVLIDKYPSGKNNGSESTFFSNYLFIPEGDKTAHNLMNFGNYLWGATGQIAGFRLGELKLGAHGNSLLNPRSNGYRPQLDSKDDQRSIKLGYLHAKKNNYKNKR